MSLNVMIVSGGGFQGLTLIKGLRESPAVRIVMVDCYSDNVSKYFVDSFHTVPQIETTGTFIQALLEICEREQVRLIIPSTEFELAALAEHRSLFEALGTRVAVSDPRFLETVRNKRSLYEFLAGEGVPVLPLLNPVVLRDVTFPIIGKPLYGWGGRGMLILRAAEETRELNLDHLAEDYVWQPYLDDRDEYSVDVAIDFDGVPSDFVVRRRIRTSGGFSVISKDVRNAPIERVVRRLLDLLSARGARGILNAQVLVRGSDFFFSDLNPRAGTSSLFCNRLGVNLPLYLCSRVDPGLAVPPAPAHERGRLKMVRYLEEMWIEELDLQRMCGLVFDLDGTLIDQKLWMAEKLQAVWEHFRQSLPSRDVFLETAVRAIEEGRSAALFDVVCDQLGIASGLKGDLVRTYRAATPSIDPLYPEVLPTLHALKRTGLKLALLTNNPPASQKQKIQAAGIEDLFDEIVFARDLGAEKPRLATFGETARRLGVAAETLAMVGDNLYRDVLGSLRAGYGAAFWVARRGSFFNFHQTLFDRFRLAGQSFRRIEDLRPLLWYVPQ